MTTKAGEPASEISGLGDDLSPAFLGWDPYSPQEGCESRI